MSIEQAIAAYSNTPAGSKAYEEWKAAPWATQGDSFTGLVQKSETELSVIRGSVQKARAERVSGLHALAASMTAATK